MWRWLSPVKSSQGEAINGRFNGLKWVLFGLGILGVLIIIAIFLQHPENKTSMAIGLADRRIVKTFMPESKAAFQYNPPTIVGDFIYIGSSSRLPPDGDFTQNLKNLPANYFYKMDLDLNIIWQYALEDKYQTAGSATLDSQGNIYFIAEDFAVATPNTIGEKKSYATNLYLYSLTNNGQFRWKQKISRDDESWLHAMTNCAIDTQDTIYVGGKKLFAFTADGNLKWQYPPVDNHEIIKNESSGNLQSQNTASGFIAGLRSSPIIDKEGNVYFISPQANDLGDESENIFAYKFTNSGSLIWSTLLENNILDPEGGTDNGGGMKERWILSSPAFGLDEKTLIAAVGNTINKVDTSTGKILWSLKPEGASGSFKASPAIDAQDNIYIGTKSNNESKFYAIKADGSGLLWKNTEIASDMYSSPLLGDDGKVYVGSESSPLKEFHALDIKTGQQVWGIDFPDSSFGSPILYQGYIYFGIFEYKTGSDTFFKVKTDANGYLPKAAWPRFHGGNANNGRTD